LLRSKLGVQVDFLASSAISSSFTVAVNNFAFPGATVKYDLDGQLVRFFDQFSKIIEPGEATFGKAHYDTRNMRCNLIFFCEKFSFLVSTIVEGSQGKIYLP
jgi:hypothetical protein